MIPMMCKVRRVGPGEVLARLCLVTVISLVMHVRVAAAGVAVDETWRVVASRAAPWNPGGGVTPRGQIGSSWRWDQARLQLGATVRCQAPRHHFLLSPAEGLFEGNLPAPAPAAARALGLRRLPLATQRIECDNASIDLHHARNGRAMTGWDGRVLTLRRSAGEVSPLATAQALLLAHFGGDMAFTRASTAAKARWLSPGLNRRIGAWMARPADPNEAPEINGDPFTDAQEYPTQFELEPASVQAGRAEVPVRLRNDGRQWQLTLELLRIGANWRIDDVRYEDGTRLRALLESRPSTRRAGVRR